MWQGVQVLVVCFAVLFGPWGIAAGQSLLFLEEALIRGVDHTYGISAYGCGIALDDLDGDQDLDLLLTGRFDGAVTVYENDGTGFFTDRTVGSGLPVDLTAHGVALGDYDGDGDLDVYLTRSAGGNLLYRNDGTFSFVDVTATAGVAGSDVWYEGAAWGDIDSDGWLDLHVSSYQIGAPNLLFLNQGDGTFVDAAPGLGVDDTGAGFQATFFDFDVDGDTDLYWTNDYGVRNYLLRNDAGELTDVSVASGLGVQMHAMCVAIGDLDADLRDDIYVTNTVSLGNRLFMGAIPGTDGLPHWTEEQFAYDVTANQVGWGAVISDFDNDRQSDIYVCNTGSENLLFKGGSPPLVDVAASAGVATSPVLSGSSSDSFNVVSGDIDGDGLLDLIVQHWLAPVSIFRNKVTTTNTWLEVRLVNTGPNSSAVGAVVEVLDDGFRQRRHVVAGTALKSSQPLTVHFGLPATDPGANAFVEEVRIQWPDGPVSVLQVVSTGQRLIVDRSLVGEFWDCNRDGTSDSAQIAAGTLVDMNLDGIPDVCQNLFVRGDVNSDGAVEISDAVSLLTVLFSGATAACPRSADTNDDRQIDIADAISILAVLFQSATMAAPYPDCGVDPTPPFGGEACDPVLCP